MILLEGVWEKEMQHPAPVLHRNVDGGNITRVPYSINISGQLSLNLPLVEVVWGWGGNVGHAVNPVVALQVSLLTVHLLLPKCLRLPVSKKRKRKKKSKNPVML